MPGVNLERQAGFFFMSLMSIRKGGDPLIAIAMTKGKRASVLSVMTNYSS